MRHMPSMPITAPATAKPLHKTAGNGLWLGSKRKAFKERAMTDLSTTETPAMESDAVFETAAEVFRVMSAPMRLKIISSLCHGEKNVSELLAEIDTTQPNMSQHLNTLYKSGVLGKRREVVQIYYRIINDRVVTLCRAVCTQIAIEGDLS
jgi:ArsR family transcriptional regulator